MPISTIRAALLALALAVPAYAAPVAAPATGVYALPDGQAKVSAALALTPAGGQVRTVPFVVAVT